MPLAPSHWQVPLLSEWRRDVKWNVDRSDEKICWCEAADEVISRFVKFVVEYDDRNHERVSKHASNGYKDEYNDLNVHFNITS